ncbi:bile acid:sodium symporter family protein [Cochleicola gelatinilyticus]|uniref:Bile acid:sodium symporter n=1 Tax=Cochleicola gelatinilyticus TaxID=1763537 RepID=A0A167HPR5_9FLAO|nr:bile acid:sodium symporter family protein [Cochleicola gelatinilyticus]OAB78835.1 bile acid:sodium symporter [Cochleicola gelatinilyticus]
MDTISTIILAGGLIVIMLGMGLSLRSEDFKRIFLYPKAIFIGLINQLIFLPLIGLCIVLLFPLQPEIAVGILILSACPGGPTSNLITHLAKGDLALSVTLTAFSSLITILTIPFIVNFALLNFYNEGTIIELDIFQTIAQIAIIVVIPILIGMFVRNRKEEFANKMGKPVRIASGILLIVIIVGIVLKERAHFASYFEQAGLATLVLNIATMLVGYITARMFRVKKEQSISIAIESGIQNGTLAITIAVILLGNSAFAIAPAVYSLLMFFSGGLLIYWGNKQT